MEGWGGEVFRWLQCATSHLDATKTYCTFKSIKLPFFIELPFSQIFLYEQVSQLIQSEARKGSQVFGAPQDDLGWKGMLVCRDHLDIQDGQERREDPS